MHEVPGHGIKDYFKVLDTKVARKNTWYLVEMTITEICEFNGGHHMGAACFEVAVPPKQVKFVEKMMPKDSAWEVKNWVHAYYLGQNPKRKNRCLDIMKLHFTNPGQPVQLWIIERHGKFFIMR